MNEIDSRPFHQTSLVLPLVGIVLILTVVFDFTLRLFYLPWDKPDQVLSYLNELIDRGVIALIGLALVFAGFWLNSAIAHPPAPPAASSPPLRNPQFWTFIFASLLGLLFLIFLPVHYSLSGEVANTAITRADQQEAQIKFQIQQEQQQLQALVASGQIDQVLQQKNLPADKLALLQELKKDPKAMDKKAAQQLEEMAKQKKQALDQVNQEVNQNRLRAEVRSFLLALGFIAIGWTGLRDAR